jgi:hypothetical protein
MEKEKLLVLIKELQQPFLISDYYYSDEDNLTEKKDLERDFSLLRTSILIIKERIELNFNNLDKQMVIMEENQGLYEIQSLIYLDILRRYIAYEIDNIEKINKKIVQLLRDGYNQYLPKPILGKRFSSVNITSQVESSLTTRLKELSKDEEANNDSLIIWEYKESYKIINKENYTIFHLSYWYFEFSYFLPNLTHEIGHTVLNQQNYKERNIKLKKEIDNLKNKILEKSLTNYNLKHIDKLSDEILADIIAFSYHGASFFYALTHQLLANDLSFMFEVTEGEVYDSNYNIINTKDINIKTSFDFWSKYRFTEKKDFVFIRLAILLFIGDEILASVNNNTEIKNKFSIKNKYEVKRLLNSIYNLEEVNFNTTILSDLKTIFSYDYANESNRQGYLETARAVEILYNGIKNFLLKHKATYLMPLIMKENIEKRSKYEDIPIYFNDIWERRFQNLVGNSPRLVHRFEFRKKLHRDTLLKLIDNGLLSMENLKPYNMVFLKYKLDSVEDIYSYNLEIDFCEKNPPKSTEQGIVFGIYDYVYLRELDKTYEIKEIKKFKTDKYETEDIRYYESGYSLMKIMNDSIGKSKNINHQLNAIIQIEIPKDLKKRDIYHDLYHDLVRIREVIEQKFISDITEYSKVEYFKSLGPKDITIRIDSASIDFIFKIKGALSTQFKRTFTTFYINNNNDDKSVDSYEKVISCKKYYFSSSIRMHPNYNPNVFLKLYKNEKNIKDIFHKTGVMDFHIVWKPNVSFSELTNFYSKLTQYKYMVEDIQTSIDKNMSLHFCSCKIC